MRERSIFFLILGVDTLILLFQTSQLSISFGEAELLYGKPSFLQYLIKLSLDIFGQNDFGLRFVMILFHLLSAILLYKISLEYIKTTRDRLWLLIVFVLLPGVISAAVIVNSAGMLIFGLFLFVYLEKRLQQSYLNVLLFTYAVIDMSFAYLFLALSLYYMMNAKRRLSLYMLGLPGVVSAAVIVNSAGMLIFGLFLFVYLEKRLQQSYLNVLLFTYAVIDMSFAYLFLALSLYYMMNAKRRLSLYMLGLYTLSSYLYGFEIGGFPTGHFLDTIGVYSAIFTPIIFIYLSYALYRRYFSLQRDIVWYISSVVFLLSLVLSFRQRLPLEHFAPYLMLALPLAAQTFSSSYRVRIKKYRRSYRLAFSLSLAFLALNTLVVFFNRELYRVVEKPSQHFAYNSNIAKELALSLKKRGINCLHTDKKMQLRLQFYSIKKCEKYYLQKLPVGTLLDTDVTIRYKNRAVYKANVTKINNQ